MMTDDGTLSPIKTVPPWANNQFFHYVGTDHFCSYLHEKNDNSKCNILDIIYCNNTWSLPVLLASFISFLLAFRISSCLERRSSAILLMISCRCTGFRAASFKLVSFAEIKIFITLCYISTSYEIYKISLNLLCLYGGIGLGCDLQPWLRDLDLWYIRNGKLGPRGTNSLNQTLPGTVKPTTATTGQKSSIWPKMVFG